MAVEGVGRGPEGNNWSGFRAAASSTTAASVAAGRDKKAKGEQSEKCNARRRDVQRQAIAAVVSVRDQELSNGSKKRTGKRAKHAVKRTRHRALVIIR